MSQEAERQDKLTEELFRLRGVDYDLSKARVRIARYEKRMRDLDDELVGAEHEVGQLKARVKELEAENRRLCSDLGKITQHNEPTL